MNRIGKTVSLVAFVALLSAGPAFTQSPSNEATSETKAAAPVAYVYVQTTKGVSLYDAAANGKLSLVMGSPFSTSGSIGGSNGKYFITVGTDYLHSYAVASNGAIGKQVSQINAQIYDGSECGDNTGSAGVLDHTGQNFYLMLVNNGCMAQQTFDIAKDSGALAFGGAVVADSTGGGCCTLMTITSNDRYGYSVLWPGPSICDPGCGNSQPGMYGFFRNNNGSLSSVGFHETDPTPEPGQGTPYYPPVAVTSDPTNHLAAIVFGAVNGKSVAQLASYTVDGEGNIASTNTWKNMPIVSTSYPGNGCIGCDSMTFLKMSPTGKLLALQTEPTCNNCDRPFGFQLFHFNGANPITPFGSVLLSNVIVWGMSWDNSNHLYVLGTELDGGRGDQKLFVYTITPTTIAEAPGSPYPVPFVGGRDLIVVPKL